MGIVVKAMADKNGGARMIKMPVGENSWEFRLDRIFVRPISKVVLLIVSDGHQFPDEEMITKDDIYHSSLDQMRIAPIGSFIKYIKLYYILYQIYHKYLIINHMYNTLNSTTSCLIS